ncbi:MAG: aldehyde dehydrogenase family protein [Smithellaceae bacterium]|nr:aldehyde dehydrogenase family protein [Smithellaceae bacterium]
MQAQQLDHVLASPNRRTIEVFSPVDGSKIGDVPSFTVDEALEALERAAVAQKAWAETPIGKRAEVISRFGRLLHENAREVATLISRENGKPLYESYMHEVLPIVHLCAYYAKRAEKILRPRPIPIWIFKIRKSYIHFRPRGVNLVISPWNFPFTIPTGAVVMNLIAGNAVLLKPASLTPLIAYKMRALFDAAGLDAALLQIISGPGQMAEELIEKGAPWLDYVNFTGSTEIGKRVAAVCGRHLIPCSMELGGKDPAIICADANLDLAAKSVVMGAFGNCGQICASVERVYAHRDIYDDFVGRVVELVKNLKQGNPLHSEEVEIGAMTSEAQLRIIEHQLNDALAKGVRVLTGGKSSPLGEMFFEPTVLVDCTGQMELVREESFGPFLPIMKVQTDEEAIAAANKSIYGLSAYVFSRNAKKAKRIAERLEAGTVMINETLLTHAFPETPWGGVKQSGMGRVHSDEGLRDLCHAYHINYDTIPIPKLFWKRFWVWHPYSSDKFSLFHALYGLIFAPYTWVRKLLQIKNLLFFSLKPTK